MTVSAKVLADSCHAITGVRLTTFLLTYPRFIHAELMTHRVFARNASSSRAIPSKRLRRMIRQDPAMPAEWGRNQAGMQAGAPIASWRQRVARFAWLAAMHVCLFAAAVLDRLGVHKQVVNRIVEPWSHITVVVTGTGAGFANFYSLRDHHMAEPVMQLLAKAMKQVHRDSTPKWLGVGHWHLPFFPLDSVCTLMGELPIPAKLSAARAARTSYLNYEGRNPTAREDLELYQRLVGQAPVHASPTEHQAQVIDPFTRGASRHAGCFGSGSGWAQHRKFIPGENITNLDEQLYGPQVV